MATTNAIIPTSTLNGIANAIIAKDSGGSMTAAQMATRIAAIQTGGWTKPSDWPDLDAIIASLHLDDYDYAVCYMFNNVPCSVTFTGQANAVDSDGNTFTGTGSHTSNFTTAQYHWIVFYGDGAFGRPVYRSGDLLWVKGRVDTIDSASDCWFYYCSRLVSVEIDVASASTYMNAYFCFNGVLAQYLRNVKGLRFGGTSFQGFMWGNGSQGSSCAPEVETDMSFVGSPTNAYRAFYYAGIREVPSCDWSGVTTCGEMFMANLFLEKVNGSLEMPNCAEQKFMFYYCGNLKKMPTMDFSNCTNVQYCFSQCTSMTEVNDTIDLSSVTSAANQNNLFQNCKSIMALPTHLTSNWSISFADCVNASKSSVQGMVDNINTCPNSGQTITLNSTIKALFTSAEQTAIESALTAKNWTLAW